jgi:hypothetical protein
MDATTSREHLDELNTSRTTRHPRNVSNGRPPTPSPPPAHHMARAGALNHWPAR